jgi:hypothetical protein
VPPGRAPLLPSTAAQRTPPGARPAPPQVRSRCLSSGSSSGMLPFIDLLNHYADARPPMLQLDDEDRLVMTVAHVRGNQLRAARAGDELAICYGGRWAVLHAGRRPRPFPVLHCTPCALPAPAGCAALAGCVSGSWDASARCPRRGVQPAGGVPQVRLRAPGAVGAATPVTVRCRVIQKWLLRSHFVIVSDQAM